MDHNYKVSDILLAVSSLVDKTDILKKNIPVENHKNLNNVKIPPETDRIISQAEMVLNYNEEEKPLILIDD